MAIITRADGTKVNVGESISEFQSRLTLNRIARTGLSSAEKEQLGNASSSIIEQKAKLFSALPVEQQKSSVTELGFGGYYDTPNGPSPVLPREVIRPYGPYKPELIEKAKDLERLKVIEKGLRSVGINTDNSRFNLVNQVNKDLKSYSKNVYISPYKNPIKNIDLRYNYPTGKDKDIALTENVMSQVKRFSLSESPRFKNIENLKSKVDYLSNLTNKLNKNYIKEEEKVSRGLGLNKIQDFLESKVSQRRELAINKLESLGQFSKAEELKAQRRQLTAGLEVTKDITSRPLRNIGEIALTTGTIKGLNLLSKTLPKVSKGIEYSLLTGYGVTKGIEGFQEYKLTGNIDKTLAFGIKDLAILGISQKLSKVTNKDLIKGYKTFDKKLLDFARPNRPKGIIELKSDQITLKELVNLKKIGKKGYIKGSGSEEEIKAIKLAEKKAKLRVEQEKYNKLSKLIEEYKKSIEIKKADNIKDIKLDKELKDLLGYKNLIRSKDITPTIKQNIKKLNRDIINRLISNKKGGDIVSFRGNKYKIKEINKISEIGYGNQKQLIVKKVKLLQKIKTKTKVKPKIKLKLKLLKTQKQKVIQKPKLLLLKTQKQKLFQKPKLKLLKVQRQRKVLIPKYKYVSKIKPINKVKPKVRPKIMPKIKPINKVKPKVRPKEVPKIKKIQRQRKVLIPKIYNFNKPNPPKKIEEKKRKILIPDIFKKEKKPIVLIPKFSFSEVSKKGKKKKGKVSKPKYFYTTTLISSMKSTKKMRIGSFTGLEVRN